MVKMTKRPPTLGVRVYRKFFSEPYALTTVAYAGLKDTMVSFSVQLAQNAL